MNILIAGQKWFGAEVLRAMHELPDVDVVAVYAPKGDRLELLAQSYGIPILKNLKPETIPPGVDLIVAAHLHEIIGEETLQKANWGGIGYHPSLLPLHRGRDAIRWAIHMGDKVTGGTVYRLTNRIDGGEILAQRHVFVRPGDTPELLWRRDLAPLGIELLVQVVSAFARDGYQQGLPQDEEIATYEPPMDRPPLYKSEWH